ncbi:MAG: hypothetical protein N2383_07170 [Caldilineales bacterium]|nr:hypothetical protein [Caldilineales bacterium]
MTTATQTQSKPLGVIDAIQRGFDLINHRLWLLLIPVLLDLFLWRGPRLSPAPWLDARLDAFLAQPELSAELPSDFLLMLEETRLMVNNLNLFALLTGLVTGLPSFMARQGTPATAPTLTITETWQVLLAVVVLIPIGLFIGSIWLALIVRGMQAETPGWGATLRRAGWLWLNLGLYLAGLTAALVGSSGFFALFLTLLLLVLGSGGLTVLSWASLFFFWLILWVGIGLSFVVSAIAVDGVNVARAVWRSLNVVTRNFPATIGLLLLGLLLTEGFARIWQQLSSRDWGIPLGMIGYAYIGTALVAAGFYFYQARYQHWIGLTKARGTRETRETPH